MFSKNDKVTVTKGHLKGLKGSITEVREPHPYLHQDIQNEILEKPYIVKFTGDAFPSMLLGDDELERSEK